MLSRRFAQTREGECQYLISWLGYERFQCSWQETADITNKKALNKFNNDIMRNVLVGATDGTNEYKAFDVFQWPPDSESVELRKVEKIYHRCKVDRAGDLGVAADRDEDGAPPPGEAFDGRLIEGFGSDSLFVHYSGA